MAELTKVKKSVMEESQVLPDMAGQSGKLLSNDGSKLRWIEIDNEWRPGDIKMFAGSESQIQAGWQLCNGVGQTSNGIIIPDLRDRFIIGSGRSYSVGSKGGSTSATTNTTGNHSHSVNVNSITLSVSQVPSHQHHAAERVNYDAEPGGMYVYGISTGTNNTQIYGRATTSSSNRHGNTSSSGSSHSHNHSASSSSSGNHNHSVNITPPYYALAFIIKL